PSRRAAPRTAGRRSARDDGRRRAMSMQATDRALGTPPPRTVGQVAVLMGGLSAEREISLRSGNACADALEGEGYRVTRVDVDRNVASKLESIRPDVCFNALHGKF